MQNSVFWTRITSLCVYQTSPVVLCMQISVISTRIRIAGPYGFQPSSVVFACKTASFVSVQRISMSPRPHLSFCACKTAWLAKELLVSMGLSPYLWFLLAKQRLLGQNYKSLCVPDLSYRFFACKSAWLAPELLSSMGSSPHLLFLHAKSDIWTRIEHLYVSQTSPVVFCMEYSVISTRITCLYGSQWFLHSKLRLLEQNYNCLWVPDHTCRFLNAILRD